MNITKNNYVSAHYLDGEHTQVEVLLREGKQIIPFIMPADWESDVGKQLLTIVTTDDLISNTYSFHKAQRKSFERNVIEIAEREGLVLTKKGEEVKKNIDK